MSDSRAQFDKTLEAAMDIVAASRVDNRGQVAPRQSTNQTMTRLGRSSLSLP